MGKLYKVGEYGEMKLGEFRKNIMQYTRNNLRSIISSSDPEIVEIAIDELTRRGEELKDGGRTGYAGGGVMQLVKKNADGSRPGYRGRDRDFQQRGMSKADYAASTRDDRQDRGDPQNINVFNPETGREGSSVADKDQQTQPRNDDPIPSQPL